MAEERIEWKQYDKVCKIIQQVQGDPDVVEKNIWNNDFCGRYTTYAYERILSLDKSSSWNYTIFL